MFTLYEPLNYKTTFSLTADLCIPMYSNLGGDCFVSYKNNFDHYIRYSLFGGLYEKLNGRPAALGLTV